jgi:hypothetical protein
LEFIFQDIPLDDYKFEMKYFVMQLESIKTLGFMWEKFDFGGIINNVQHRVYQAAKDGDYP